MDDNNMDPDPWLAKDKLYHVLFCLTLTFFFSAWASVSRYSFIRTHSIRVGSILSLLAGAAKEAADQLGLFPSAGASFKDAIADVIGVLIASSALSLWRICSSSRHGSDSGRTRRVLPV
ncbi:transmembrane protein [Citrus sinensis]|uniref:Transmembrane protein n=1 Tax=Citrus sinensis TaxID=2711 RepID=A0ACB8JD59_CITSI|nr:transmembrane protein [Citrus sinensis]